MKSVFIEYPKCSTCQNAKKWLDLHQIQYENRHIVEKTPNAQELKKWHLQSGLPLKRFFNTSGLVYKELGLKERLETLTEEEQYQLLATNGMLIKRPLLISDEFILIGFRLQEWENLFCGQ